MRIALPSGTPAELITSQTASRGLAIAPDIMGLRPLFTDMAASLAAENNWSVCAVEPFPGREWMGPEERLEAAAGLDDERQLGDLVAAADATGVEPAGVVGFCIGGMYALKAAGTGRFDRAVSFYGMIRVPDMWHGGAHGEPLDAVTAPGAAQVLALLGGKDRWTPPADIEALRAAGAQVVVYDEAEHGFVHDPARPAHRPDDAKDAWSRAIEFLAG